MPVPVIFTMHGWDPRNQALKDWLAERLRQVYPLFQGRDGTAEAKGLVASGQIAVILDGLDEISEVLRPVALGELSKQADFRLVVLCRSDEAVAAAQTEFLSAAAAIELQDVDPETAADYLRLVQRDPPSAGWADLIGQLRNAPDSPIAKAMNSPLRLTLVRDTYHEGDDVHELLDFCATGGITPTDIEDHLLDRVLPAAYKEGDRSYDLASAERTLRHIAAQMGKDETYDLAWWQISGWAPLAPRWIGTGILIGVMAGFVASIQAGWWAAVVGLMGFGLVGPVAQGGRSPQRIARLRWRQLFALGPLGYGLGIGLCGAVGLWLDSTLTAALVAGPVVGFASWIAAGYLVALSDPGDENASPLTPLASWRRDRVSGIFVGVAAALVVGVLRALSDDVSYGGPLGRFTKSMVTWLRLPHQGWSEAALLEDIGVALVIGVVVALAFSGTWAASGAFGQLAWRWHTPVRLLRFLDDAREREVLRTVGPLYQFRHRRLQDRLAGATAPAIPGRVPAMAHNPAVSAEALADLGQSRTEPPGQIAPGQLT